MLVDNSIFQDNHRICISSNHLKAQFLVLALATKNPDGDISETKRAIIRDPVDQDFWVRFLKPLLALGSKWGENLTRQAKACFSRGLKLCWYEFGLDLGNLEKLGWWQVMFSSQIYSLNNWGTEVSIWSLKGTKGEVKQARRVSNKKLEGH